MSREVHVQFWESVRVRSPRATQLPLYRQQGIFERAGVKLPISTLADWVGVCGVRLGPLVEALRETVLSCGVLHADETPIQVLRPDTGRKTHRAYLWAYAPGAFEDLKAVVYDFTPSRAGEHA
ncbi:Transposase and inactivated derivatives [Oligella ureolytica]|nr:Transposase and inactivated derivatives [Oligella ureolytica]